MDTTNGVFSTLRKYRSDIVTRHIYSAVLLTLLMLVTSAESTGYANLDDVRYDVIGDYKCDTSIFHIFGRECDPNFRICMSTDRSNVDCKETTTTNNANTIVFSRAFPQFTVQTRLSNWTGQLNISISIRDDNFGRLNEFDKIIYIYNANITSLAVPNIVPGEKGRARMTFTMKIHCDANYFGPKCNKYCTNTQHGTCDQLGNLICSPGYTGQQCGIIVTSPSSVETSTLHSTKVTSAHTTTTSSVNTIIMVATFTNPKAPSSSLLNASTLYTGTMYIPSQMTKILQSTHVEQTGTGHYVTRQNGNVTKKSSNFTSLLPTISTEFFTSKTSTRKSSWKLNSASSAGPALNITKFTSTTTRKTLATTTNPKVFTTSYHSTKAYLTSENYSKPLSMHPSTIPTTKYLSSTSKSTSSHQSSIAAINFTTSIPSSFANVTAIFTSRPTATTTPTYTAVFTSRSATTTHPRVFTSRFTPKATVAHPATVTSQSTPKISLAHSKTGISRLTIPTSVALTATYRLRSTSITPVSHLENITSRSVTTPFAHSTTSISRSTPTTPVTHSATFTMRPTPRVPVSHSVFFTSLLTQTTPVAHLANYTLRSTPTSPVAHSATFTSRSTPGTSVSRSAAFTSRLIRTTAVADLENYTSQSLPTTWMAHSASFTSRSTQKTSNARSVNSTLLSTRTRPISHSTTFTHLTNSIPVAHSVTHTSRSIPTTSVAHSATFTSQSTGYHSTAFTSQSTGSHSTAFTSRSTGSHSTAFSSRLTPITPLVHWQNYTSQSLPTTRVTHSATFTSQSTQKTLIAHSANSTLQSTQTTPVFHLATFFSRLTSTIPTAHPPTYSSRLTPKSPVVHTVSLTSQSTLTTLVSNLPNPTLNSTPTKQAFHSATSTSQSTLTTLVSNLPNPTLNSTPTKQAFHSATSTSQSTLTTLVSNLPNPTLNSTPTKQAFHSATSTSQSTLATLVSNLPNPTLNLTPTKQAFHSATSTSQSTLATLVSNLPNPTLNLTPTKQAFHSATSTSQSTLTTLVGYSTIEPSNYSLSFSTGSEITEALPTSRGKTSPNTNTVAMNSARTLTSKDITEILTTEVGSTYKSSISKKDDQTFLLIKGDGRRKVNGLKMKLKQILGISLRCSEQLITVDISSHLFYGENRQVITQFSFTVQYGGRMLSSKEVSQTLATQGDPDKILSSELSALEMEEYRGKVLESIQDNKLKEDKEDWIRNHIAVVCGVGGAVLVLMVGILIFIVRRVRYGKRSENDSKYFNDDDDATFDKSHHKLVNVKSTKDNIVFVDNPLYGTVSEI